MKKKNYIVELMFMGFLFVIAMAFGITLIESENDPLQIVDSVEYARVIIGLFMAYYHCDSTNAEGVCGVSESKPRGT